MDRWQRWIKRSDFENKKAGTPYAVPAFYSLQKLKSVSTVLIASCGDLDISNEIALQVFVFETALNPFICSRAYSAVLGRMDTGFGELQRLISMRKELIDETYCADSLCAVCSTLMPGIGTSSG